MHGLGEALRKLRTERGWSQARLATMAGVSQQLIAKIESGHVVESRKLPRIARAFGMTVEELLASVPAGTKVLPTTGTATTVTQCTHDGPCWPFTSFDRARWDRLSKEEQSQVEGAALMVLLDIESRRRQSARPKSRRQAGR